MRSSSSPRRRAPPPEPESAERYRPLRAAARSEGIEAAYRPLLLQVLARRFVTAPPSEQRAMLAERRDDLRDPIASQVIGRLDAENDPRPVRARALLALAAQPDTAPLDRAFDALGEPDRFEALLPETVRDTPDLLAAMSALALTAATDGVQASRAHLYFALATLLHGNQAHAVELTRQAAHLSPESRDAWIVELAELTTQHPAAAALIPHLMSAPQGEEQ